MPAAWTIQRAIMTDKWLQATVMPNYTPHNWYECDVLEITGSGYMVEYEVKVSRGNVKDDAKKRHAHDSFTKHERLAEHDPYGPTRFYFVVPHGLITSADVPLWAGLLYFHGGYVREIKPAPRLHNEKVSAKVMENVRKTAYYRMHREFGSGTYGEFSDGAGI